MTNAERQARDEALLLRIKQRIKVSKEREEAKAIRVKKRHLWKLAMVLDEVGLGNADPETLRPYLQQVAVTISLDNGEVSGN